MSQALAPLRSQVRCWVEARHRSRDAGALLPPGFPRLMAAEGKKGVQSPPAEGGGESWGDGEARAPCRGRMGVWQVQDKSGEIRRRFDPLAVCQPTRVDVVGETVASLEALRLLRCLQWNPSSSCDGFCVSVALV